MKAQSMLFVAGMFVMVLFLGLNVGAEENKDKGYGEGFLYTCDCGETCACNDVSTKPGKCSCGNPLKPGNILKLDGNEAILCDCGGGCKCALDKNDPTKCSCGKTVKQVSVGGLYTCNCGSECTCNTVSDKPGNCACGAPLKKRE